MYLVVFTFGTHASGNYALALQLQFSLFGASDNTKDISIYNLSVYPNPVSDLLKISFKSSKQCKASISLFNSIGNQVITNEFQVEAGTNLIPIDLGKNAVEPGFYFVQIEVEKEVFMRKLIVR